MSNQKRKLSLNPFRSRRKRAQSTAGQSVESPGSPSRGGTILRRFSIFSSNSPAEEPEVRRSDSVSNHQRRKGSAKISPSKESIGSFRKDQRYDRGLPVEKSSNQPSYHPNEQGHTESTANIQKSSTLPQTHPRSTDVLEELQAKLRGQNWNRTHRRENILALGSSYGVQDTAADSKVSDPYEPQSTTMERPNFLLLPPESQSLQGDGTPDDYSPHGGFQKNPSRSRIKCATIPARYGQRHRGGLIDPLEKAPFHMMRMPDVDELEINETPNILRTTGNDKQQGRTAVADIWQSKSSLKSEATSEGNSLANSPTRTTTMDQAATAVKALHFESQLNSLGAATNHDRKTAHVRYNLTPVDLGVQSGPPSPESATEFPIDLTRAATPGPRPTKLVAIPHWKRRDYPQEETIRLQTSGYAGSADDESTTEPLPPVGIPNPTVSNKMQGSRQSVNSDAPQNGSSEIQQAPSQRNNAGPPSDDDSPRSLRQPQRKGSKIAYVYPFNQEESNKRPSLPSSTRSTAVLAKSYSAPTSGRTMDSQNPLGSSRTVANVTPPLSYPLSKRRPKPESTMETEPITEGKQLNLNSRMDSLDSVIDDSVIEYIDESLTDSSTSKPPRTRTAAEETVGDHSEGLHYTNDNGMPEAAIYNNAATAPLDDEETNSFAATDAQAGQPESGDRGLQKVEDRLKEYEARLAILNKDFDLNEATGQRIIKGLEAAGIGEAECTKLIRHIEETGRIVCLQLKLKLQLEKVDHTLAALPDDASQDESKPFLQRKSRLVSELEDVRMLQQRTKAKARSVMKLICSNLSEPDAKAYFHFLKVREHLLVATGRLEEKIRLGEDRMRYLMSSE